MGITIVNVLQNKMTSNKGNITVTEYKIWQYKSQCGPDMNIFSHATIYGQ